MGDPRLASIDDGSTDPFDRLVLKGQSIKPIHSGHPAVGVVELADEFGLTTAAALDICDSLSIRALDASVSVSAPDAERFRVEAKRCREESAKPIETASPVLSLRARLEHHR